MSEFNNGGGGVIETSLYQPTSEDYKRRFQEDYKARRQHVQEDKVRRQAIKEILQDQVKNAVKPDERLDDVFRKQISK